jgi:hypothetical protein
LVTEFAATDPVPMALPADKCSAELAWARETAIDFLASLLGGDHEYVLTMNIMTDAFKQRLPSPSVHDTGLGYAKKDVRNWLNGVRDGASEFAIATQALDGGSAVFSGEINGKGVRRPFHLALARDGEVWKVDALDLKQ